MGKRAFWPGFRWCVLAHRRPVRHRPETTDSFVLYCGKTPSHGGNWVALDNEWEFDELVIDDWAHLEQMDLRHWWMRVGNQDRNTLIVNVTIDRDGAASVSVEWV